MSTFAAVLMCSLLWLGPVSGEAVTTGEQRPEQRQLISKAHLKLVQERFKAEGVSASRWRVARHTAGCICWAA
jgi:hypothetical protein